MTFVPIKNLSPWFTCGIKDASFTNNNTALAFLDADGYLWGCGSQVSMMDIDNGANVARSSPVPFIGKKWLTVSDGVCLDESSYAWCFGNGNLLGNNTNNTLNWFPIPLDTNRTWKKIERRGTLGAGLDSSNYLYTWGTNATGCLGDNSSSNRSSPVSVVGNRKFIDFAITSSSYRICALDESSYAWAWGNNSPYGGIGDNTILDRSSPVSVVGGRQFIKLFANYQNIFAMDASSYIWSCGYNYNGGFGDGTQQLRSSFVSVLGGPWKTYHPYYQGSIFEKSDDSYFYAGANNPYNALIASSSPVAMCFPEKISKMLIGANGYISTSSNLWVWNDNSSGQLGVGTTINVSVPKKPLYQSVVSYSAYTPLKSVKNLFNIVTRQNSLYTDGFVLDNSGYIYRWGLNSSTRPQLFYGKKFISVVAGTDASLVYTAYCLDESSYLWGFGSVGSGLTISSPVSILGGYRWSKIDSTRGGTIPGGCGITESSFAYAWGGGSLGRLGNNLTTDSYSSPVSVLGGFIAKDIASTSSSTCLLDESGYAWSWGNNGLGQLGVNDIISRSSPVSVVGGKQFSKIYGSYDGFYAIDTSSYLWAWGGSVPEGTSLVSRSSPTSVVGGIQWRELATLYGNCSSPLMAGIDISSNAWAWGINNVGQLGDATVNPRSSPVSVLGGYKFKSLAINFFGLEGLLYNRDDLFVITGSIPYAYNRVLNLIGTATNNMVLHPVVVGVEKTYISNPVFTPLKTNILGK